MNVIDTLKELNINKEDNIIIGVSAGPDSMALLHMLHTNLPNKIICAHINHKLRKISDEEEIYLENYCKNNNIIFEKTNIDKYNKNNLENEAREKRYEFYEKILKKYDSKYLFLAHHGDDLIETVLMKIARGSNLEGYAGIKLISKLENYTIVRPLLSFTKEDLLIYNKDNNIKYYIDDTNSDETYTRNRYRKKIVPLLKEEDNNIHLKFLKYSNILTDYYNYIERTVTNKIKNIVLDNNININLLLKEDEFIVKQLIYYVLCEVYDNKSNIIKEKNLDDIIRLCHSDKPNKSINLPCNYLAIKEYDKLIIKKQEIKKNNYNIIFKDVYTNNNLNIKIERVKEISSDGNDVCRLNSKNIKLPIHVRTRMNGDTIELYNSLHHKKVKDIFIEKKIPKNIRQEYPIITDDNGNILWIPNLKKSKYNVKKDNFYDIILYSYKEREENNEQK